MSTEPWGGLRRRAVAGGCALVLVAGGLGLGLAAGGAGAAAPTLTVDRSTGLLRGQLVNVSGSGFTPESPGMVTECSTAAGQPTVPVNGGVLPVSCSTVSGGFGLFVPPLAFVDVAGSLTASFVVQTGIVGPPSLDIDSAGRNAAADAALYPCPPTDAQQAAGAGCELTFTSFAGEQASAPISFGPPATLNPAATVTPSTALSDGDTVTVHATGLTPGSPAVVVECNTTPGQPPNPSLPTLPAACTNPLAAASPLPVSHSPLTGDGGTFTSSFTVKEGNVGAAPQTVAYPCPPTAANVAAGGACQVIVLDAAFDKAAATITLTGPVPQPSLTVFPAGGLTDGSVVAVAGTHYTPLSNGAALECNRAPGQPTVPVAGFATPVGCSDAFRALVNADGDGLVLGSLRVRTGVVGPPAPGTDSAGNAAADDAALYPCPPTAAQQAAGVTCDVLVGDLAGDTGIQPISFASESPGFPGRPGVGRASARPSGYRTAGSDGGVFAFAGAPFLGSLPGLGVHPSAPIVGMASSADGLGYWLVAADGGVFGFGDAPYLGSLPALHIRPAAPIVALAVTPDGGGYWLVGADGGVFGFGDAAYFGSLPALHIAGASRIVGAAGDPSGKGYWLLAVDGGILGFGDAPGHIGSLAEPPGTAPAPAPAKPVG